MTLSTSSPQQNGLAASADMQLSLSRVMQCSRCSACHKDTSAVLAALYTLDDVPTESLHGCMATVCAALTRKVLCRLM